MYAAMNFDEDQTVVERPGDGTGLQVVAADNRATQ